MPSLQTIQTIYDTKAPNYDQTVGLTENFLLGDFRKSFGSALRGATLEIAIGSGLNLPFYSDAVTETTGVDVSNGMLALARKRADDLNLAIELLQMDAEHLGFAAHSFDTVAISLALCTTPKPALAVREIARVCRPGGRVVFLEHVRSPNRAVAFAEHVWSPVQERALGCSLVRNTVELIESERFVIERERSRFFGVFRLIIALPPPVE